MAKRRRRPHPNRPPTGGAVRTAAARPRTASARRLSLPAIALGAAAVLGVGILVAALLSSPGEATARPSPIAGVTCDELEHSDYHIHAHLAIRFDGASQSVPTDIGIRSTCLYWLHTHTGDGIIHVEAPASASFTLGQFFDVWAQPLSADRVLGRTIGPAESLWVYLNGERFEGDPRAIVLANLMTIELQVGPGAVTPEPWAWPAGYG